MCELNMATPLSSVAPINFVGEYLIRAHDVRNYCVVARESTGEILQATRAGLCPAPPTNEKSRQIREHPDTRVSYLAALHVRRAGPRPAGRSQNLCSICV